MQNVAGSLSTTDNKVRSCTRNQISDKSSFYGHINHPTLKLEAHKFISSNLIFFISKNVGYHCEIQVSSSRRRTGKILIDIATTIHRKTYRSTKKSDKWHFYQWSFVVTTTTLCLWQRFNLRRTSHKFKDDFKTPTQSMTGGKNPWTTLKKEHS